VRFSSVFEANYDLYLIAYNSTVLSCAVYRGKQEVIINSPDQQSG